jgi:hypothetical protein
VAKRTATGKKVGRPTKCTPETVAKIVEAVRVGNYAETAARLAGIDDQTYWNWVKAGEKGEEPYKSFLGAVKEAEGEAERAALARVNAGGSGPDQVSWQSAAWYLERKFPKKYGRRDPDKAAQADLDRRLKQLEIERLEAQIAALKAQQSTGPVEPANDDAIDRMMRERFGAAKVYPFAEGEPKH